MSSAKKKTASRVKVQAKPQAKIQTKAKPASAANASWSQSSAKLYPFAQINSQSAEQASQAAAKQMQDAAEQMMKYSSDFMQQIFSGATNPASLNGSFQSSATKTNRDAADQLSKTAANATKSVNDAMELSRENTEALVECGNIAASVSKQMGAEITNYINKTFTQNSELSKQLLACRTLNDMFDLQNKFIKANLDAFFTESVKLSEMAFQCMSDVSEPLNERVSETTERLSKAFAA